MGHSELLADKVEKKVADVIYKLISKVHLIPDETPITEYLTEFRDFWMNLCNQMQTYRDVFYYLERTYLLRERNQSLWQIALSLVKTKITEDAKHKLCEGVLQLIAEDRKSDTVEGRNLIAKLIHVMLALDFYKIFEAGFCTQTTDYYRVSANEAFEQLNVSNMMIITVCFYFLVVILYDLFGAVGQQRASKV